MPATIKKPRKIILEQNGPSPDHTPQPSPSSASTPKETQPSALDHNEDHHRRSRTFKFLHSEFFFHTLNFVFLSHYINHHISLYG